MWRCEGGDLIVSHKNDHGPSHRRLQSVAAVEASKNPLWRNFLYGSIFDFCNNIGTYRTSEFSANVRCAPGADVRNSNVMEFCSGKSAFSANPPPQGAPLESDGGQAFFNASAQSRREFGRRQNERLNSYTRSADSR